MSGYSAVLLLFVFLLPGAFFAWGFERNVPRYGKKLKDWLLRLAGMSAVCLAAGAWLLHWLVTSHWDDFAAGRMLPWPVYLAPVVYVAAPAAVGWGCGWLLGRSRPTGALYQRILAPRRAPTAWDHLFAQGTAGFVRCRLHSGRWVGGLYDRSNPVTSYTSDGEVAQDLYIARAAEFDQDTGAAVMRRGDYAWTQGGIYLKMDDIESLDFVPLPEPNSTTTVEVGENG